MAENGEIWPIPTLNSKVIPAHNSLDNDELAYLGKAQKGVTSLHEKLQSASNKLTTAHINMLKKFPFCTKKVMNVKKKEGKQEEGSGQPTRAEGTSALGNLISIEIVGQMYGSVEGSDRITPESSNTADFPKKLTRRLHLDR